MDTAISQMSIIINGNKNKREVLTSHEYTKIKSMQGKLSVADPEQLRE